MQGPQAALVPVIVQLVEPEESVALPGREPGFIWLIDNDRALAYISTESLNLC
jgi:hypothetical protein